MLAMPEYATENFKGLSQVVPEIMGPRFEKKHTMRISRFTDKASGQFQNAISPRLTISSL